MPINVQTDDDGTPLRLVVEGHTHAVEQVANHWRVDATWWRIRVWRDYFKLVTGSGMLVLIYHDILNGGWFLQRVYD